MKMRGVESELGPLAAARREPADRRDQFPSTGSRTGIRTGTSESVSLSLFPLTPHHQCPLLLTRCLLLCSLGCPIRIAVPNRYGYMPHVLLTVSAFVQHLPRGHRTGGLLDPRAVL